MLKDETPEVIQRAQAPSQRLAALARELGARLKPHRWSLLIVTAGVVFVHVFLLTHHPTMLASTDSIEYLAVTNSILTTGPSSTRSGRLAIRHFWRWSS